MSSEFNVDALVWVIDGRQHISFIDCGDPECEILYVSHLIETVFEFKGVTNNEYIDSYYNVFKPCLRDIPDFAVRIQGRYIYSEGNKVWVDRVELDEIQDVDIEYAVLVGGNEQ